MRSARHAPMHLILVLFIVLTSTGYALAVPVSLAAVRQDGAAARGHFLEAARKKRRTRKQTSKRDAATPRIPADAQGDAEVALPARRPALPTDPQPERKLAEKDKDASEKEQSAVKPGEEKAAVPLGPPPPPPAWTEPEIKAANATCTHLLDGISVDYEKVDPIREGVCGDAAPIRLKGFNGSPEVRLRPAATTNCAMTAALNKWLATVVQPRAKELLDAAIIRMNNASSYVCRTRYGNPTKRMSEHAYANAFDVSEFITAKGERINVLDHWSGTDEKAAFLRDIHAGACRIFGTTLGPEANEAHKNHFHFDMKVRRRPLCDWSAGRRPILVKSEGNTSVPVGPPSNAPLPERRMENAGGPSPLTIPLPEKRIVKIKPVRKKRASR